MKGISPCGKKLYQTPSFTACFCKDLSSEYSTGIAGLAVTYGINLNVQQASVIWNICNAENKMISVERILQYSNIASEAPLVIEDHRPPANWPDIGTIQFTNLKVSSFSEQKGSLIPVTSMLNSKCNIIIFAAHNQLQ